MNYKILSKFCFCLLVFLINFIFVASSFDQKVVLVTGASQGLGLALAKKLAQSGYYVYGSVRKTSNLSELQQAIRDYPQNLSFVVLDVTDEASIVEAVCFIIQQSGSIDVLINNACEVFIGTAETCTIEEQRRVMDVNYFGV